MSTRNLKLVYVISERNGRSFWNRIGIAFLNTDGSLNVKLDAVPVTGELQIRDYVPRHEASDAVGSSSSGAALALAQTA